MNGLNVGLIRFDAILIAQEQVVEALSPESSTFSFPSDQRFSKKFTFIDA